MRRDGSGSLRDLEEAVEGLKIVEGTARDVRGRDSKGGVKNGSNDILEGLTDRLDGMNPFQ